MLTRVRLIALISFLILAIPLIGTYWYGQNLTSFSKQHSVNAAQKKADCGVVLTGGANRVREGLVKLARKQVRKLVISGVGAGAQLLDIFPDLAFYPEVNLSDVVLEKSSGSTASNAQNSLLLSEALGCQSVLLISSDYHLFRAYRTFRAVFPATVGVTAIPVWSDRLPWDSSWYLSGRSWAVVSEETFKFIFYRLALL